MEQFLAAARDAAWVRLAAALPGRGATTLRFELLRHVGAKPASQWVVSCQRVREMTLTVDDFGGLNFWRDDHPALAQFTSRKSSLTIHLGGRSVAECAGVLLRAHWNAVDDWIEFDRFAVRDGELTAASGRVSVGGPRFLMEAYHRELRESGFAAQLKPYKRALYWSGLGWSERKRDVSMLHFGNSFVVAEAFSAELDRS
jgi:hypothetical protein